MRYELICHPHTPAKSVRAVQAEWTTNDDNGVLLTFSVDGFEAVVLPDALSPVRTDELWRTTCFELFWMPVGSQAYIEFNLSPSLCWAAYAFDGYRAGMCDHPMTIDPVIERTTDGIEADVDFSTLRPGPVRIGLSAVIEETDGTKSYWALKHPPGKPDFHHPDCFALELSAPELS